MAGAETEAEQSYLQESWISYVLTTGANWGGTIGRFHLTVDKGDADTLVSFCGNGVKKTGPTTFELTATDFYPERNIDIALIRQTALEFDQLNASRVRFPSAVTERPSTAVTV